MTVYRIPFNKPYLTGLEGDLVAELGRLGHLSGDGTFTQRAQAILEDELSAHQALLTTSGTHALELAAILTNVGSGDEVILPSFTFVSTANAFVLRGATPVFVDVREDTLNLDEHLLGDAITDRTKVVVPVHYAGVGCEMDEIMTVAHAAHAVVVEDNALGLFGSYKGRPLGSFGALACQSFHETKSFSCGEGGALVINAPELSARAEIVREKGTDRSQFFRGLVDKYTWRDIGSSYLPSDILAAFLWAQLEQRASIRARRRAIWERYHVELADWATANGVRQPTVPDHCEAAHGSYHLVLSEPTERDALIARLRDQGILSVFHYLPLHLSPMGLAFGGQPGQLPVTEWVSDRLVRLPFFNDLQESEQHDVIRAVTGTNGR
ncbi:MAG: dTDP-4-amino-4,6-dideoxygalactose transaminase [Acidimicrobiaceae bacterium]|jgi:dTDP-4-amino-4,6-dideoxygalactose transaminase